MTREAFDALLGALDTLSPEQLQRLRLEVDGKLAAVEPSRPEPSTSDGPSAMVEPASAPDREPIWERFRAISSSLPTEVWESLPEDGSEQLDHYVYGTPRRPGSQ